ncbi:D-alanyl-D-alanine dipeptidase [Chromobacterium phragmitis]|uniref:D-alanyl-D-alanine dipeptidase n=1 Tax=Chromobacterium phragmitis TaxID=2202141 RepID=A0A344UL03_9NEIS|nr:M15 family metallopeptidase [Chromobacterium phragmitis]AXE30579.1 D-alanyl-D-alanine dipeptidase [Chromobacterium phragmitis]AXE35951.1 D-alanyl-D-alanine dipeptidase [Chromobacterium phragmitis]
MRATIQLEELSDHPEYLSIAGIGGVALDLRYAGADNFVGRNLYGEQAPALLHRKAAERLAAAARELANRRPCHRLRVFDALRPGRVQRVLWDIVKDTPQRIYVADPARGSIHSFGMAVDITVEDGAGRQLDMGTGFDDFTELAQPQREADMLAQGRLSDAQLANRLLLRGCMEAAGFRGILTEWWHFEAADRDWVRAHMRLVE